MDQKGNNNQAAVGADYLPSLYDELRRLATHLFRHQPADHTLQPTALVHEAFLKIADHSGGKWANRVHLYAVAARAMRQILVDHARRRHADKRGAGWSRIALTDLPFQGHNVQIDLLALDETLEELARLNDRQARIVEMRFLAGLTIDETAEALGVSPETVKLDWRMARAWLRTRLRTGEIR